MSKTIRSNARIWSGAEQFCKAADALFEGDDLARLVFPVVVNYALSVELALKSTVGIVDVKPPTTGGLVFAARTQSDAWGHKLHSEVFTDLPATIRADLEMEFKTLTQQDLQPLLVRCNDYFVGARYAHEYIGGSYDLSGLQTLARGVLKATKNLGLKSEGLPPEK